MLRRSQRLQDKLNRQEDGVCSTTATHTRQPHRLGKVKITLGGSIYAPPPVALRRLSTEEFRDRFVRRKIDPLDIWVADLVDRMARDGDAKCLLTVECVTVREYRVFTAFLT